jgi:glucose-1-phosphate adenylyltransferase
MPGKRDRQCAGDVGEDPELDARRFRRSENGICLITQTMIDKLEL